MILNYTKPSIYTFGGHKGKNAFRLIPGMNEVKREDFEVANKNKIFRSLIENKTIIVAEQKDIDISTMSNNKLKDYIENLFDYKKLQELSNDKRKFVQDLAKAKLAQIDGARKN